MSNSLWSNPIPLLWYCQFDGLPVNYSDFDVKLAKVICSHDMHCLSKIFFYHFLHLICRYKVIVCKPNLPGTKENCIKILKATGIKGWQVGKTKVFLKYYHLDQIAEVLERMGKSAISIQRFIRGYLDRKVVARKLEVARQQAEKIQGLLTQIQGLSMQLSSQQQAALKNDKNIPQSKCHPKCLF